MFWIHSTFTWGHCHTRKIISSGIQGNTVGLGDMFKFSNRPPSAPDRKTHQNHLGKSFHSSKNHQLWFGRNKPWIHRVRFENILALHIHTVFLFCLYLALLLVGSLDKSLWLSSDSHSFFGGRPLHLQKHLASSIIFCNQRLESKNPKITYLYWKSGDNDRWPKDLGILSCN